ncbi:hypothetical protein [Streptomyces capitiformicae]|uniref:Lipoprotein n=1 Tax=Streptomyces capitiformicae TaxID=2014920 RepID=A0A918Z3P7_9ACTN|nr:hypothetical protein [Streptomyces capitiformicae]GHE32838.1 hypothetical protein GCM10017771_49690 [Streptomyces capitiformicae]
MGMRVMAGRNSAAAGLAAVALVVGLTACTGDEKDEPKSSGKSDKAAVKACADGTFTWTGVKKTEKLTGVSQIESVGAGGGKLTERLERVYTPRPSVETTGPAISSGEVLFSLGKKIGEIQSDARTLAEAEAEGDTSSFTDVNVKAPDINDGSTEVDGAGEFVEFAGVREVAGDFSYACPDGKTTTGHARTWQIDITGVLQCDEEVDGSDLALQAARHSCEEGSAATESA